MIFDLKEEILNITKAYADLHGIDMKMPDSNTALLSQHETAQHLADKAPANIPNFADEMECKQVVGKELSKSLADVFAQRDVMLAYGEKRKPEETLELLKKLSALELAMYAEYQ